MDGRRGGKSDTTKLSKVCHDEPPTTTGEPSIDVGGIQAQRPDAPATSGTAAAVAVSAEPKFTG